MGLMGVHQFLVSCHIHSFEIDKVPHHYILKLYDNLKLFTRKKF